MSVELRCSMDHFGSYAARSRLKCLMEKNCFEMSSIGLMLKLEFYSLQICVYFVGCNLCRFLWQSCCCCCWVWAGIILIHAGHCGAASRRILRWSQTWCKGALTASLWLHGSIYLMKWVKCSANRCEGHLINKLLIAPSTFVTWLKAKVSKQVAFEAKRRPDLLKAMTFCAQTVLMVEDSPWWPLRSCYF